MPSAPEIVKVEGVLTRFIWRSDSSDWIIAELETEDGPWTIKGPLPSPEKGLCYRIEGPRGEDAFGAHVKIRTSLPVIPTTARAIRAFLQALPGIGRATAEIMVQKWGTAALEKFRVAELEELRAVGIKTSEKRLKEARLAMEGASKGAELRLTLQSMLGDQGTDAMVKKCVDEWGSDGPNIIRAHPWRLTELPGVGFLTADAVARHLGHATDSPERIEAGTLHAMEAIRSSGDTATFKTFLAGRAADVLDLDGSPQDYGADIADAIDRLDSEGALVGLSKDRIQTMGDRFRECAIARILEERTSRHEGWSPTTIHEIVAEGLADDQKEAISVLANKPTALLIGPPGTGKTFTVRALLPYFARGKVRLCAPTGKAARRLEESTGHKATTIHTLLEPRPQKRDGKLVFGFSRNEANPLENVDVVVVDEFSMVDTWLFDALLHALPKSCRLILVGDANQLPSVGPGAVLRDLLEAGTLPFYSLEEIKRTNPGELLTHIHAVRAGEWEPVKNSLDGDLFVLEAGSEENAVEKIVDLYLNRLPKVLEEGEDPILTVQILLPWKTKGKLSVRGVNEIVQKRRIEAGAVTLQKPKIGIGEKVVQTRNDYDLGIVNGDLGVIQTIEKRVPEGSKTARLFYVVDFAGYAEPVLVPAYGNDLELAYALTVHKSQGSEWPIVILPALGTSSPFYDKTLFYTALSRAKRRGIIVGNQSNLWRVLQRDNASRRRTNLLECLKGGSRAERADGGWTFPKEAAS